MNSSNNEITITVKVDKNGFIFYDDTRSFIEAFHKEDENDLLDTIKEHIKERINGKERASIW